MITHKLKPRWSEMSGAYDYLNLTEAQVIRPGVVEIAGWLWADIQNSLENLKSVIDVIKNPPRESVCDIYNAHWILITQGYVYLSCEYTDDRVLMTKEQAIYILEQYQLFLESDYYDKDKEPDPIDVEYIAENGEADKLYSALEGAFSLPPAFLD